MADTQFDECQLLLNAKYTTDNDNKRPGRVFQMNDSKCRTTTEYDMWEADWDIFYSIEADISLPPILCHTLYSRL